MSRWFRFYDEALNDPKVQMLPADDFKSWVNLLCLASQNDGKIKDIQSVAFALRIGVNDAVTVLERLSIAGLIDKANGGANGFHYVPHGWGKRQYKSDTSNDRVKRHREKKRNVTITPPDTETETDNSVGKPTAAEPQQNDPIEPAVETVDPLKVMFDSGIRLLGQSGTPEHRARPMLGKWRQRYGAEAVITALGAAQREGAIDPISFIEGSLKNGQRPNSYRDGRSAWLNADGTGLGGVGDERQLFD